MDWKTSSSDIKYFVSHVLAETKEILEDEFIGFYIHGSLAMGGFNPKSSDVDVLIVSENPLNLDVKRKLAQFFVTYSNHPYPVEISFVNQHDLRDWKHPCPFDFHYSEDWRKRYENDLHEGTNHYINDEQMTDADLAAHITITNHRGICIEGLPIKEVFPVVPRSHYLSSIMGDFQDCLENIEQEPIYCALNLIRVYWFVKEGKISSKQEAGNWGLATLPKELNATIQKVVNSYATEKESYDFDKNELFTFRDYINRNVQELLK